ncbi:MAG: thiamine phosphate synthase [Candidatus Omnitrophota bacterium]
MRSKKDLLKESRLCVILDRETLKGKDILRVAYEAARGGADMLQLRDKTPLSHANIDVARRLKKIAAGFRIPFIVNDNAAVALASGADGLHIGRGDISVKLARRLMGAAAILGVSAHTYGEAARASHDGADYIGAGPVFKTPIKSDMRPEGVDEIVKMERLKVPVFAIGGIDAGNTPWLAARGIRRIAVIRAVCAAHDVRAMTERLKEELS